jgi:inhibitor of cysteine peptidase
MRLLAFCRCSVVVGCLVVASSLAVSACGGGTEIPVGRSASGTTITAATGDVLVLKLPENLTTGYSWSMTLSEGLSLDGEAYMQGEDAGDLVGAGGTHEWHIKVTATGKQTIDGVYRQEWDPTQSPEYFTLTVAVQ